ncbi:NUDIX hydrolase [Microvirga rosea]|uniref:NUDIX hydrolase n=1 Tax=Microvirga rosea TaxID=2715425 RepID=UPI001D0BA56A|nr:NUDIX domain-containing protein [Microvirga rosea]MCB8823099.1 NUDIX domain-containing protein [Microvirga rosea]
MKEPRCGCGAAILKDRKLLLVQRLKAPEAGHWGLPGGKVDWLEHVEEAVIREVEEELGIRLRDLRLLCVVDQIDATADEHWIAPVYAALAFNGIPLLREPHKHRAFGWFSLDDLPSPLTRATEVAASALRQGQARDGSG